MAKAAADVLTRMLFVWTPVYAISGGQAQARIVMESRSGTGLKEPT
jgi:hypothetical protein